MKIDPNLLRIAEWFDADNHETVFVVELRRKGTWVGVMLSGEPQVFTNKTDAELLIQFLSGREVPEQNITRRATCVARFDGGKGIVPQKMKHVPLN